MCLFSGRFSALSVLINVLNSQAEARHSCFYTRKSAGLQPGYVLDRNSKKAVKNYLTRLISPEKTFQTAYNKFSFIRPTIHV